MVKLYIKTASGRKYNPQATSWMRWLSACGLPPAHVAVLIGLTEDEVAGYAPRRCTRPPTGPPKKSGVGHAIHGPNATKIRQLREMGYPPARIGKILEVPIADVRSFLARLEPVRRAALVKPRSKADHAGMKDNQRRRRQRQRRRRPPTPPPPSAPPPGEWQWRIDGGPIGVVELPIAAELAAAAEPPQPTMDALPKRDPWTGPADRQARGESHGSAKLTAADAREIRRLHAMGRSIYSLAPQFGVSKSAIRAIVRGETWTDC